MRNRIYILFIIIAGIIRLNGQTAEKIPDIIPPTPQAIEMVRYGKIPINEYQGMAQVSIPVAEVKDNDLQNIITLNYSKAGIKVADYPNNAGMGWLLQMGGVITRTVNDLPDESEISTRLIFDNLQQVQNIADATDGSANGFILNSYDLNVVYDNEIDIFEFSVNGLTGKFFLDKNLKPTLLSKSDPMRIETVGNFSTTHEFIITGIDGVKYYFGGEDAIERTFRRSIDYASNNITSFYLTKLKDVKGNEINFTYSHFGPKTYTLSQTEQIGVRFTQSSCVIGNPSGASQIPHSRQIEILRVKDAISLTSITGREKTVNISYDQISGGNIVSSVKVIHNRNSREVEQIDFEYLTQYSSNDPASTVERYFLTKIKKYTFDNSNNKLFNGEYSFEYDDPFGLPDRMSYSVDAFGYYNGKSNSTFLPDLQLLRNVDTSSFTPFNYADRRSVFDNAKKGVLLSITYPTKGKTVFEYEGLDHKEQFVDGRGLSVFNNGSIFTDNVLLDGMGIIENKVKGIVSITENNPKISNYSKYPIKVNLTVTNASSNQILLDKEISFQRPNEEEQTNGYRELQDSFVFDTDEYTKYNINLTLIEKEGIDYEGNAVLSFTNEQVRKNNIGIRLKKIYDIDGNGKQNIKRIYYSALRNILANLQEPISNLYPGGYRTEIYHAGPCLRSSEVGVPAGGFPSGAYALEQTILTSAPKGTLSWENYYEPFLYPHVTISYGGDFFEKGGEEKTFVTGQMENNFILRLPDTGIPGVQPDLFLGSSFGSLLSSATTDSSRKFSYDDLNGKPSEIKQFKREGENLLLQSKTIFNYVTGTANIAFDLMVRRLYNIALIPTGFDINNITSNLIVSHSPVISYNTALIKKIENRYFGNVPADTADDSPYYKVQTISDYTYDNPLHYQLTNQKTTFPDLSTQETYYQYAHEKIKTDMIAANMVGIPLETTVLKNGKTISKSGLDYQKKTISGKELILPDVAYGYDLQNPSAFTTEVKYKEYDNKGNLVQYNLKPNANGESGNPVTIIWGYNQTHPIAKIEGAKLSDISQTLIDSIVNASDYTNANYSESTLLNQLDAFRTALPNFQISTYTYKPLIGVTTITPPSGIREYYFYDTANRLETVKDVNGNILKEYQYHYKP